MLTWWSYRRVSWVAAATIAVVAMVVFLATRSSKSPPEPTVAKISLALQWPSEPPFDSGALEAWGSPDATLPKGTPDFDRSTGTLGGGGTDRFTRWRLATVIVRSPDGWGSGAFISADGWLLTNYHVVAGSAQQAAVTGRAATLEVIPPRIVGGGAKPQSPLSATLYRTDPVHDLALLKLEALPVGIKEMPYFQLANQVRDGEDCFVVGSQYNGPAWWIRSGNVSQQFDFPEDLSQFAAGAASPGGIMNRASARVIVTDARVSEGDSGGPLLNASGELMGLTFATPANHSGGSVGWHIALRHLRSFIAELPTRPEGVPFDPWTAGLPHAARIQPELADGDGDGRFDSVRYRYARQAEQGSAGAATRLVALTVFVDFSQRAARSNDPLDRLPAGLWGMENRGRFRFDLFLTTRADRVTAVGYANAEGVVDEIRIAQSQQDAATVIWRRDSQGKWHATSPSVPTWLVDSSRVGPDNMRRLQAIAGHMMAVRAQRQPSDEGGKRGPNKM